MAKKPFHHGDLRRSLLDATIRLIDAKGVRGFTLADASREAGVSKGAPYRHFTSKEAILIAVAAECFDHFEAHLARAALNPDPAASLRAMMHAYLDTALDRPAEFRTMFAAGLDKSEHRELSVRAEKCFAHLKAAVARCLAGQPLAPARAAPDALRLTMQLWIGVHGVSTLAIDGSLGKLGGKRNAAALVDDLIATHLGTTASQPPR